MGPSPRVSQWISAPSGRVTFLTEEILAMRITSLCDDVTWKRKAQMPYSTTAMPETIVTDYDYEQFREDGGLVVRLHVAPG
jgi:hypothetical protein